VLAVEGVTYIYWQIEGPSKFVFVRVLAVEGVTYIYYQIDWP
jgi:hypothetical protein